MEKSPFYSQIIAVYSETCKEVTLFRGTCLLTGAVFWGSLERNYSANVHYTNATLLCQQLLFHAISFSKRKKGIMFHSL